MTDTRRAMTMLEMLLALALLSVLAAAAVSWTTSMTRAAAERGAHARWTTAARATLTFIDECFTIEDTPSNRDERWRAHVGTDLTIWTRRVLELPNNESRICRQVRFRRQDTDVVVDLMGPEGQVLKTRPLLGECAAFDVTLETAPDNPTTSVSIRFLRVGGRLESERTWRLDREFVR